MIRYPNKILFMFFFLIIVKLNAQDSNYRHRSAQLDRGKNHSFSIYRQPSGMLCGIVINHPKPFKTYSEIENEIRKSIYPDTLSLTRRLFIKAFIDTNGIVRRLTILRTSKKQRIDSIVTNYISKLKFISGTTRTGEKVGSQIIIPFPIGKKAND